MIPQFTDKAEFTIRFQPFQLYPDLPQGDSEGVDKKSFFKKLGEERRPHEDEKDRHARFQALKDAWSIEGLQLSFSGGNLGHSFNAQRLISFARKQGREDQMVEEIYTAQHVHDKCLSSYKVLLQAAENAGVQGAEQMLRSDQEVASTTTKIQDYFAQGLTAVPVIIFNEKFPIMGAPERELLYVVIAQLLEKGNLTALQGHPRLPVCA